MTRKLLTLALVINIHACFGSILNSKWHYPCTAGYCIKSLITTNTSIAQSLGECNILCVDSAAVWPKPSGSISVKNLVEVDIEKFSLSTARNTSISILLESAFNIFTSQLRSQVPCRSFFKRKSANRSSVIVNIEVADLKTDRMNFDTNESYFIEASQGNTTVINVRIVAQTFFGARHALETLSQLVAYDDLRNRTLFPSGIHIVDGPAYGWRGITVDTARNFITPKAIKRTLRAMAASKLNTFHWHLTDTASWPYESKSHPELSEYGAYSPRKVYTQQIVNDIVEYARVRGIRVVPELDAPAHVGEGFEQTGVVTCFNWKPWDSYCVEPPCGQLDPSRPEVYDILEDVYGDMLDQFGNDVFHMGGDEVNVNCWNNTLNLTKWMISEKGWGLDTTDFINKVWGYFQIEAAKRLYLKAGKEIPIILWSSDLTNSENATDILPPSKYIIQIWSSIDASDVQSLLDKNYSIILSNSDSLYLDCGFAGWVSGGNNWCSPYKGWQLVYDNKPSRIPGNRTSQVLGGNTALWTEQAGSSNLDSRLWPRAAAFAETLWTDPATGWQEAEERMLIHTQRLINLGIEADELEPEWCLRNQQTCPTGGRFNK